MSKGQPKDKENKEIHIDEKIDKELKEIRKAEDFDAYKNSFKHFMQEIENTPDFFEKSPEEQKEISLRNIKKYKK